MSDDLERTLEQLTPRLAPAPLRDRVLTGVRSELLNQKSARRMRWIAATLAAVILFGVGLNLRLHNSQKARMSALLGPEPVPRQIVETTRMVEQVTDKETAMWFQDEMLKSARKRREPAGGLDKYWLALQSQLEKRE